MLLTQETLADLMLAQLAEAELAAPLLALVMLVVPVPHCKWLAAVEHQVMLLAQWLGAMAVQADALLAEVGAAHQGLALTQVLVALVVMAIAAFTLGKVNDDALCDN